MQIFHCLYGILNDLLCDTKYYVQINCFFFAYKMVLYYNTIQFNELDE